MDDLEKARFAQLAIDAYKDELDDAQRLGYEILADIVASDRPPERRIAASMQLLGLLGM